MPLLYQARRKVRMLWCLSRDPAPVLAGISGKTEKHHHIKNRRWPDKQNFNCVVGFHLLQDPITDENKTPCLSAGSPTGEASLGVCAEQETQYIVRRLTPLECERLQGYPDGWTDIGEWTDSKGKVHKESADSARYKALGNSIAIPPWTYV